MKRKILFRGKRVDNGEWIEGYYRYWENSIGNIFHTIYVNPIICDHVVIPETVGQFTGLTDNNGKKIFEGDIVVYSNDAPGIVIYDNQQFVATIKGSTHKTHLHIMEGVNKWKVIGNIYDNPELLK